MTRRVVLRLSVFAVLLLAACGGTAEVALDGAVAEPPLMVGDEQLPDARTGEPFTFRAPPGELLAVYFGYTQCPDLCPTTMADIKVALGQLDPEDAGRVSVAMVTVDPERDDPALLDAYLSGFFGAEHAVPLRTEDFAALHEVEAAFLATSTVVDVDNDGEVEVAHTSTTSVVDDAGVVQVQWLFGTTAESMAHDLRILLAR